MSESLAATAMATGPDEATGSGVPLAGVVTVIASGTELTVWVWTLVAVWPAPSPIATVIAQVCALPVRLAGAVQVGACSAASLKLPWPGNPVQSALHA